MAIVQSVQCHKCLVASFINEQCLFRVFLSSNFVVRLGTYHNRSSYAVKKEYS
jgi:hypothetical protein